MIDKPAEYTPAHGEWIELMRKVQPLDGHRLAARMTCNFPGLDMHTACRIHTYHEQQRVAAQP